MDAYGVTRDQIKGPTWAIADAVDGGATFDVSANIPPGATQEQIATMLQNLLKDRFKLSLHRETSRSPGFAMVVAKRGTKLKQSVGPVQESEHATIGARGRVDLQVGKDGFPALFPNRNMGGTFASCQDVRASGECGRVRARFRDYELSDLAEQLSFALGIRVQDKTALGGKYDFTLDFMPAENEQQRVGISMTLPLAPGRKAQLSGDPQTPHLPDSLPIVSSAMEKQLGLTLEATKIAVDMLVIDHVEETPTDN